MYLRLALVALLAVAFGNHAFAQKKYDPGASDTEIKIGNTMPYSGPVSAFSVIGRTAEAYFKKVNAEGGINGRKINFITLDDGYSPPKTVQQVRQLVESDEVLLTFLLAGTASNTAVQSYLNEKGIPQLFISTSASKWADPQHFPWTMGFLTSFMAEAKIYAQYILQNYPKAKVGILYQNDDFGKDMLNGLKQGLGDSAKSMIVSEQSYDVSEPTVDSQILKLSDDGVEVLVNASTPKFAAQSIRKMGQLGWKPVHIMNFAGTSVGGVLKPAGIDYAVGMVSAFSLKDATDPTWTNDAGMKEWNAFMDTYMPGSDKTNALSVYSYAVAWSMAYVLKQSGDDLTRKNIMNQAANLKNVAVPVLLPGITLNTTPTNYNPINQLQMAKFNGQRWELFGPILHAE